MVHTVWLCLIWVLSASSAASPPHGALSATSSEYPASLTLVDQLGWAASTRDLSRYVRDATGPDSLYSRSYRVADRGRGSALEGAALYAVEATVLQASDPSTATGQVVGLGIRQAVVYRNPASVPLDLVVMRVFGNGQDIHRDLASVRGVWVDNSPAEWILDGTLLVVALPRPLGPRDTARILLDLHQRVPWFDPQRRPREVDGSPTFLTEETGAYGWNGDRINLGFWLPLVTPVSREGRFDVRPLRENTEHAWFDPALFHVVLDVPAPWTVAATGVEVTRRESSGRATVVGVASGAREFAVMLGKGLAQRSVEVGGTRLRVSYPADQPELGADLVSHAEGALRTFTDLYGPLAAAEVDLIEAPSRIAAGIEFPGVMTVDLLHKRRDGRYVGLPDHEWTIAHEIAHQWWAAEVGNDPGDAPWLDEGLSNHAAAVYWERKYGRAALEERWAIEILGPYGRLRDSGSVDLPANQPAWRYDLTQYSTFVYGRAALFFDRVRAEIGAETFAKAMRAYYRGHRGGHVSAEDLLGVLRMHASDPDRVDALYQRWIAEGHGYEDLLE